MSRTNWILLVMGGLACLAMTWTMQRAASLQVQRARPPALSEVEALLGRRLDGPARLVFTDVEAGARAELRIRAAPGIRVDRLALEAGHVVWRVGDPERTIAEVVVVCRSDDEERRGYRVPPPWRPTDRLVELGPEDVPSAVPPRPR